MVSYQQRKPNHDLLFPYIDSFAQISGEKLISKQIAPQLGTSLVLDFNNTTLYEDQRLHTAMITPQQSSFNMRALSACNDKLIIKFSSYGLCAFLKIPMDVLNNQIINAQDVFGSNLIDLYTSLQPITSFDNRVFLLEKFLLQRFIEPSATEKMIFRLSDAIKQNLDLHSVSLLKKSLPLSVRQVERNFKKIIGTDMSTFSRIVRFEKARQLLENKSLPKLTDIAYQVGYYDQSHFIADFKMLVGTNPKRYQYC